MDEGKSCDNCAHKGMLSEDQDGNRIVDCDINEFQMFAPFSTDCIHWEKALD